MEVAKVKSVIPVATSVVLLLALASVLVAPVSNQVETPLVLGVILAMVATWTLFALNLQSSQRTWFMLTFWVALLGIALTVYATGSTSGTYLFLYMIVAALLAIMPTIELLVAGIASLAVVLMLQAVLSVSSTTPSAVLMVVTVWITVSSLGAGAWQLVNGMDSSERRLGRVKANNEALKTAEKDKTEILSLVSHQLKTPLALIRWSVESVLDNPHLKDKERSRLESAIGTTHVMYNTIEDLSHIFKLIMRGSQQYMRSEKVVISELLTEIKSEYTAIVDQRKIKLTMRMPHHTVTAKADRIFLKHAIVNLIDNAVKYSPDNTEIVVAAKAERDRVYLAVTDHGIGIEPANQDRIFERFFRTEKAREINQHGTGLGLYLVRVIMEKMGGQVTLSSHLGKGSTFTLIVPRG